MATGKLPTSFSKADQAHGDADAANEALSNSFSKLNLKGMGNGRLRPNRPGATPDPGTSEPGRIIKEIAATAVLKADADDVLERDTKQNAPMDEIYVDESLDESGLIIDKTPTRKSGTSPAEELAAGSKVLSAMLEFEAEMKRPGSAIAKRSREWYRPLVPLGYHCPSATYAARLAQSRKVPFIAAFSRFVLAIVTAVVRQTA
jgi:hypothetical protein